VRLEFLLAAAVIACTPAIAPSVVLVRAPPIAEVVDDPKEDLARAARSDATAEEYETQHDLDAALELRREALRLRERTLGKEHIDVARSAMRVVHVEWLLGRTDDVAQLVDAAMPVLRRELGPDDVEVGRALDMRGSVPLHARRYGEARPYFMLAAVIFEKHDSSADLVDVLSDLGLTYKGEREYPRAVETFERAVALAEKTFGADSARLGTSVGNLGETYRMMGDASHAAPLLERAAALTEKAYGSEDRRYASALNNLAACYHYLQHDLVRAEPLYRRALAISEKVLGPDSINTAQEYLNLGGLLCAKGDWANGEPMYQKGLAVFDAKMGRDHLETIRARDYFAGLAKNRKP
jgi:tetratricopeptide (TPR) repeat protein